MSSEDVSKLCPNCKKRDVTSFSKCRYCSTYYNAQISENRETSVDQLFLMGLCIVALLAGGLFLARNSLKEAKNKRLAATISDIRATHRPRLIEFYADWCGPCRSYGPIVEECRTKYQDRVDFQRLDVDDPNNRPIVTEFEVHGIPLTCLFDSQGNEIRETVGGLSSEELDSDIRKLIDSK